MSTGDNGVASHASRLAELVALVAPPAEPAPPQRSTLERVAGGRLPSDFLSMVSTYGPGIFNGFVRLHGVSSIPAFDFATRYGWERQMLAELGPESLPYDSDTLLPWGSTINGDILLWERIGPEPDRWPVLVVDDGSDWSFHPGSCSSFLYGLLTRRIDCWIFPAADFFAGPLTFTRRDSAG